MKGSITLLLGGLVAGAVAAPAGADRHVLHERRAVADAAYGRWVKREPLDAATKVPVRLALKQRNLDKGMEYLLEVSDPDSGRYGQHYTQDQIVDLFAPDESSVAEVKRWLVSSGISEAAIVVPRSKAWVNFDATVGQLESLLKTRYHVYDHVEARDEHIGTDEYHLPELVARHVDFVMPGVAFAPRRRSGLAARASKRPQTKVVPLSAAMAAKIKADPLAVDDCSTVITPACIKSQYRIPDGKLADASNKLGIFETDDQKYGQDDFDQFVEAAAPHVPKGTAPTVRNIDGVNGTAGPFESGEETMLDFDIAVPIIYPQSTELWIAPVQKDDIFNTFLDAVDGSYCSYKGGDDPDIDGVTPNEQCGAFKPSNVISFSYGLAEADYPKTSYLTRQCDEFMKLALAGTTLVMSSGDDGVARRSGPCLGSKQDIFTPDVAADCPYITTVGSTTLPAGGGAETATTSFSSGGGFSNIYTTPDYQKAAVTQYLTAHNPGYPSYNTSGGKVPDSGGIYNAHGRGYPDMSALGDNAVFAWQGELYQTGGGTSMSAPLVAAIFTRINDERIKAGKGPVGFVNPTLYKHPEMFNDVTVGNQDKGGPGGDDQPSVCGNKGFLAAAGWDPVTGMGTPNYPKMLDVFLKQ